MKLPRLIGFTKGRPWLERLCTFLIFSFLPTAFFWAYFVISVWHHLPKAYVGLRIAAPISSLWITFGPLLMQQGEFNLERLIKAFNDDGPQAGWNYDDIQCAINRAYRIFYLLTVPMAVGAAAAIGIAYPALSSVLPLNAYSKSTGLFDLLVIGFVSASGIWGVFMALSVVRAATVRAEVPWHPFRSERPRGVNQLYSFVWSVALIFSVGNVFLPGLLVVRQRLTGLPGVIVLLFVVLLFTGGLLLFSVPAFMLYRMAQGQQDAALDMLASVIESDMLKVRTLNQGAYSARRVYYSLASALQLRSAISAQNPAPVFSTLARAGTTLALPIFLTLLQFATTFIK